MPTAAASAPQPSRSAAKRAASPAPGRTAPNLTKQQPSPASLAGPQWHTANPASRPVSLPQQQGVAEAARRDSADLGAEIEAVIKHVGQLAAGGFGGAPIAVRQLT